jgi:Spy/CpxP family protein refolding chaperone
MKFFPYALTIAAAASVAIAAPALAQSIKPGLWETTNKVGGAAGRKMQEAMAMIQQMPPEQRAKIEAMMGRQGVVVNNDGVVAKVCITPEMAARQQLPMQKQGNGNCDVQQGPMVGNTMKFSFTCTNGSGEGNATFTSPTAYTSSTRMTTNATGASESVEVASTGRWLATDCGAVKPSAQ